MREQQASLAGTIAAWVVAFLMVFPILWMLVTSFKTEAEAIANPPLLIFKPVLESFAAALSQSGYILFAENSIIVSLLSTALALIIAFPAAYSMAFTPGRRTQ
ncbi:MAG: carbohydrate ABC transporter permease, partial [Acetobacteraceae bacterium]